MAETGRSAAAAARGRRPGYLVLTVVLSLVTMGLVLAQASLREILETAAPPTGRTAPHGPGSVAPVQADLTRETIFP